MIDTKLDKQNTILLFQLSALLKSDRFFKLYSNNISRFSMHVDCTGLYNKLRKDFLYQLDQAVDWEFKKGFLSTSLNRHIPPKVLFDQISKDIRRFAEIYGALVAKKNMSFVLPKHTQLIDEVYRKFNFLACQDICRELSLLDKPYNQINSFGIRMVLSELGGFIESVYTLHSDTGHKRYEKMLSKFIKNIDYFVNGYPKDMLCHDICAIKNNSVISVFARRDYCSTILHTPADDYYSDELLEFAM